MTARRAARSLTRRSPRSCAPRLLCLPHAGGRGERYRGWAAEAGEALEVWTTDLPGRFTETDEPPMVDLDEAIAVLAEDAASLLDRPLAIFAHSMGALLAFEVARVLERRGETLAALFVSGCPAPHVRARRMHRPSCDADLVALLRRWGGTPEPLLHDEEFLALALPSLRADLALLDRYEPRPGTVSVPLTAFAGAQDNAATVEQVRQWSRCSTCWRGLRVLPGGHFFIDDGRGEIIDTVITTFACA